jgi:hypothetical protein
MVGTTLLAGMDFERRNRKERRESAYYSSESEGPPNAMFGLVEVLIAFVLGFALMVVLIVWLLVVAPLQYVVFLICGAPQGWFLWVGRSHNCYHKARIPG